MIPDLRLQVSDRRLQLGVLILESSVPKIGVPALVARELFEILAVFVHRPEIHRAVAIGQKIDPAVPLRVEA
jgi:hypothetical protein